MTWQGRHRAGRRRRRPRRRSRRTEILPWGPYSGRDPGLDPPHRSLSEGRGLPYTPLIRALLPLFAAAGVAVTALALTAGLLFG